MTALLPCVNTIDARWVAPIADGREFCRERGASASILTDVFVENAICQLGLSREIEDAHESGSCLVLIAMPPHYFVQLQESRESVEACAAILPRQPHTSLTR